MIHSVYQFIINDFSVGNWFQTLAFYFVLFAMLHVILVQLDFSFIKLVKLDSDNTGEGPSLE
jgi:hypothetical protein